MKIKVAAFTVSEKSSNTILLQLKKSLGDLTESSKKKEMLLISELDSYKMKSEELEKMLKTNTTVNRIEKEKINEMHLQTVKVGLTLFLPFTANVLYPGSRVRSLAPAVCRMRLLSHGPSPYDLSCSSDVKHELTTNVVYFLIC